jgi:UDP-N-acetyl-D-mannosaminuronate dehydrogenase
VDSVRIDDGVEHSVELTADRLAAADAVVITTDHRCVDYDFVTEHAAIVVDPRNAIAGTRGAIVYPIAGPPRLPADATSEALQPA